MNEDLHLSDRGARRVKAFESCLKPTDRARTHFKPYICPGGRLTIGWGHTNDHGRQFDGSAVWSQAECDAAFMEDMAYFEPAVRRLVKVRLNQDQFDALVSFAYNCGAGNLAKSTLLRKVNRGDFEGAAAEFGRWNRSAGKVLAGLTRRRASEALGFQGILDENYDGRADTDQRAMPQAVDAPVTKTLTDSKTVKGALTAAAGAAAPAAGAVINAASEPDVAPTITERITDVVDHAGTVLQTSKTVIDALPPPPKGLLASVATVLTDPFVVGIFLIVALLGAGFVVIERRRKLREEGV
jgi:lysozyme